MISESSVSGLDNVSCPSAMGEPACPADAAADQDKVVDVLTLNTPIAGKRRVAMAHTRADRAAGRGLEDVRRGEIPQTADLLLEGGYRRLRDANHWPGMRARSREWTSLYFQY
jgi:hypothetical protein